MKFSGVAVVVMSVFSAPAFAEDVSQTVGHGQINWSAKTVRATGSGAPSLKAANVAVARLGAERAAKMDAYRNVLETLRGVKVSGGETAGATMDKSPEVKAKVEGVIQGFKVVDTKYYSDGGVDIILEGPIDGVLADLVSGAGKQAATGAAADGSTGLIVNAKGMAVTPALAPRLVSESGEELYSAAMVSAEAIRKDGAVAYVKSLEQANKESRVGGKALVVKAARPSDKGSPDLVISAADAEKISKLKGVLGEGRVIIVTD